MDGSERTHDQAVRLASLASMARVLGRLGGVNETVERAAEEALVALDAASVSVSRLVPGTGMVQVIVNVGDLAPGEERHPEHEVYRLEEFRLLLQVVSEQRAWFASHDDPDIDPAELELLAKLGKASALGAPILVDGSLWGEFYATRAHGAQPFSEADRSYVEALVAIMGSALGRDIHVAALQGLAYQDPLTGLHNRRSLEEAGERAVAEHLAAHAVASLAVIDVDGLKRINDTHGHAEGDRLLIVVARLLVDAFAALPGTMIARVGGDEFCALVPGHDAEVVRRIAEPACSRDLPGGAGLSCGIADTRRLRRPTFYALYTAADAAQYSAKRAGGGHVRMSGEPLDP